MLVFHSFLQIDEILVFGRFDEMNDLLNDVVLPRVVVRNLFDYRDVGIFVDGFSQLPERIVLFHLNHKLFAHTYLLITN